MTTSPVQPLTRRGIRVLELGSNLKGDAGHRRGVEIGDRPRALQLDRDVGNDPARSGGQDDHPVGDQDRLGDAVSHHDDGRGGPLPEPEQLQVEPLAGQRVEGWFEFDGEKMLSKRVEFSTADEEDLYR